MYFWTPFWNKKQLHSGSFPFWWKNVGCFQCAESLQINTTTPIFLTIWHGQVTKKYALMFFLWEICPGFSFLWCATFCSSFCFCSLPSKRVRCSIHVEVVVKSCKQIWKRNEKLRTKNCWKEKSKTPRDRCRTHLRCDSYSCIFCVLSECRCLCKGHMSMNKPAKKNVSIWLPPLHAQNGLHKIVIC